VLGSIDICQIYRSHILFTSTRCVVFTFFPTLLGVLLIVCLSYFPLYPACS
jgi:hypothetical protein